MPLLHQIVPAVLLLLALIHFLPLAGVLGAVKLSFLYGISIQDPNLEILMRHRAVLFGLLAAFLAYSAFHRHLHGLALIAAASSVVSFLLLALEAGNYNQAMASVVKVDVVASMLVLLATMVHLQAPMIQPRVSSRDSVKGAS
jgi:hypothetical protein